MLFTDRRKEILYLTTHSTHFIYGYIAPELQIEYQTLMSKITFQCSGVIRSCKMSGHQTKIGLSSSFPESKTSSKALSHSNLNKPLKSTHRHNCTHARTYMVSRSKYFFGLCLFVEIRCANLNCSLLVYCRIDSMRNKGTAIDWELFVGVVRLRGVWEFGVAG